MNKRSVKLLEKMGCAFFDMGNLYRKRSREIVRGNRESSVFLDKERELLLIDMEHVLAKVCIYLPEDFRVFLEKVHAILECRFVSNEDAYSFLNQFGGKEFVQRIADVLNQVMNNLRACFYYLCKIYLRHGEGGDYKYGLEIHGLTEMSELVDQDPEIRACWGFLLLPGNFDSESVDNDFKKIKEKLQVSDKD